MLQDTGTALAEIYDAAPAGNFSATTPRLINVAVTKTIAAEYKIKDGPNDAGEMFEREGRPADRFPRPWANENAARAQYGAVPPDFSVIAKARTYERGFPWFIFDIFTQFQEQGVDYIVALMQGVSNFGGYCDGCTGI